MRKAKVTLKPKPAAKTKIAPLPRKTASLLRKLMKEQGVVGKSRVENLRGKGKDLWDSDEDFEAFLKSIDDMRRQNLTPIQ